MKCRIVILFLLVFTSQFIPKFARAQAQNAQEKKSAPHQVAILAGRLIDGKSDKPILNALIVIQEGRILSVTPNVTHAPAWPSGVEVETIDLSHSTVLPGLI